MRQRKAGQYACYAAGHLGSNPLICTVIERRTVDRVPSVCQASAFLVGSRGTKATQKSRLSNCPHFTDGKASPIGSSDLDRI